MYERQTIVPTDGGLNKRQRCAEGPCVKTMLGDRNPMVRSAIPLGFKFIAVFVEFE